MVNELFFCSWFGRVEILGHYSKSPTGCLQPYVLFCCCFFYPVTLYLSYLFLITIYIRNSCNYRSGIYSNKRHGTYESIKQMLRNNKISKCCIKSLIRGSAYSSKYCKFTSSSHIVFTIVLYSSLSRTIGMLTLITYIFFLCVQLVF